jgi:tRNA threonylcarbamoyladenosine biosynthesis protein TsaE
VTKSQSFISKSLEQSDEIAKQIAAQVSFPMCVYFEGELGSGKTTLIKSIIRSFGYQGAVTSPTYNLIQEYPCDFGTIYHMDLYRLNDPFELEFLALNDLWGEQSLFLVEWPDKGFGFLPEASLSVSISKNDHAREIRLTRR